MNLLNIHNLRAKKREKDKEAKVEEEETTNRRNEKGIMIQKISLL